MVFIFQGLELDLRIQVAYVPMVWHQANRNSYFNILILFHILGFGKFAIAPI